MDISTHEFPRHISVIDTAVKRGANEQNAPSVTGENLVIDASQNAYQQATQVFRQLGHEVAESPFREDAVSHDFDKVKAQYRSMMMASKSTTDQYKRVEDGRSHIAGVKGLIDHIHSDYQKKYGEIVKASTQYMQDVNTALGKMSQYVSAGKDGKINFKPKAFLMDFDAVISKYSGIEYSDYSSFYTDSSYSEAELLSEYCEMWGQDLGKENNTDKTTHNKNIMRFYLSTLDSSEYGMKTPPLYTIKASSDINVEFNFWEKKLSGQGFVVKKSGNEILIHPDFKPIREIYRNVANSSASWGGSDIAAQELQSLQTAIDSQKNAVNNSVSRLLETFRQDNSHFETLVQLLIQLIKDLNQNNNSLINM